MWRAKEYPPAEEFLALLIERQDMWSRALFEALHGAKRIRVPAPVQILRPSEKAPERKKVETDPRVIAAFFRQHISG